MTALRGAFLDEGVEHALVLLLQAAAVALLLLRVLGGAGADALRAVEAAAAGRDEKVHGLDERLQGATWREAR